MHSHSAFTISHATNVALPGLKVAEDAIPVTGRFFQMNAYKQVEVLGDNSPQKGNSENKRSFENRNSESNSQMLSEMLKEINKQSITGEFGAKLDSIIRHIQYIKETSNGRKRADADKFQNDPDMTVILLHSRSHSSGLTLVAAHTVFIVEPVLNEALERQAINRVHRIGQTHETNVFHYIIQDTIEERIHSIYNTKQNRDTNTALAEGDLELSKYSEGGGEFVHDDDLRRCFTENETYAFGS
ncbi:hypothetical protein RO3G_06868 [Rhizopus delemar RA 99-880]|uniref:Helicase C-terminal domain-containing protein n=1 Tax=Rhizopus delemar (strain RA 99-880 / ATCC MYA-4621 / FGSC 9543 / NRRL 43880) TaxID=246409 RepID=I1C133_RHIO9|nr:hypothetical protein RO3G_06868 [Rhizopus delemar RA 99-880]|eukprot:EIE82163.1 hypothetical protein RO3G_06868 [Rhizopus delemar RA 99-880]